MEQFTWCRILSVVPVLMGHQEMVLMLEDELVRAVLTNQFKEAKWTQTVALALLQRTSAELLKRLDERVRLGSAYIRWPCWDH
jgi:DUF1680 family protein